MDDRMISDLLDAMSHTRLLQELVIKRNAFLDSSLTALESILLLEHPNNLIELRLVNCETNNRVMRQLLHSLGNFENVSHLRSLAIVQMKLNFALDDLAQLVQNSEALQDLDLSCNDCVPMHFESLLKALAYNHTLHTVNLSWNTLIDRKDQVSKKA